MAAAAVASPSSFRIAMSRRASQRSSPPLSIDLSDIPSLIQPTPPSNTLLITNLHEPSIFHPQSLQTISDLLVQHSPEPILHFAPLKSFRRIVVAFPTTEGAVAIRQALDGDTLMGCRIRVYFGEPTPIHPTDQHLQAPKSDKLFFISPPPSPPAGWEMRNEEPPNKEVHAEDLATALARLSARKAPADDNNGDDGHDADHEMGDAGVGPGTAVQQVKRTSFEGRQRSGTQTIVYHPEDHGHSPVLPSISVEDTTVSPGDVSPMEVDKKPMPKTERPPMDLSMER